MDQSRRKLTVSAIARELGLSKTTVSRALSGKGRISQDTRDRISEFIRQAGYEAASPENRLERRQTNNLALVIPPHFVQLDLPFLRKSMGGICRMAAQRGYDILLCYADDDHTEQLERQLAANKVDGVILSRTLQTDPCLDLVRRYGVPFVVMGRLKDEAALQVDNDHVSAARELTRLLLQMGVRRIAYMGNRVAYTVSRDRLTGFQMAMEEHHLKVAPDMVFSDLNTEESRIDALEAALEQKPECLLCGDDSLAFDLLQDLRQRGIRVPEELKLASLYDSEILVNMSPTVTAVQFDSAALGTAACRLLLDFIAGREAAPRQIQGYQVILRESTK